MKTEGGQDRELGKVECNIDLSADARRESPLCEKILEFYDKVHRRTVQILNGMCLASDYKSARFRSF